MPNGFQGSHDEWRRMEAPYVRIDSILDAFAARHGVAVRKNYRDADRSLCWSDGIEWAIWIGPMDTYGLTGTYQVSATAYQERGGERHVKHGIVANGVGVDELAGVLERARTILASWSEGDLHLPKAGGETSELL